MDLVLVFGFGIIWIWNYLDLVSKYMVGTQIHGGEPKYMVGSPDTWWPGQPAGQMTQASKYVMAWPASQPALVGGPGLRWSRHICFPHQILDAGSIFDIDEQLVHGLVRASLQDLMFSSLLSDLSMDSSALVPFVDLAYPNSSPRPGGATIAVELDVRAPGMQ